MINRSLRLDPAPADQHERSDGGVERLRVVARALCSDGLGHPLGDAKSQNRRATNKVATRFRSGRAGIPKSKRPRRTTG